MLKRLLNFLIQKQAHARAFDGLPEAVLMEKSEHPFMIAVQFHPERLEEDNIIHTTMKENFYKEIRK